MISRRLCRGALTPTCFTTFTRKATKRHACGSKAETLKTRRAPVDMSLESLPEAGKSGESAAALEDTIVAIATALGAGALAVIRLSGAQALAIASSVFKPAGGAAQLPSRAASHTTHYGWIIRSGQTLDEVMLTVLRAPRTFTREDTVEISCHGGVLAAKLILDALLEKGARPATPGEFTKRAFLNGRIDLAQAEAIADLIHSRTELALSAAQEQLA